MVTVFWLYQRETKEFLIFGCHNTRTILARTDLQVNIIISYTIWLGFFFLIILDILLSVLQPFHVVSRNFRLRAIFHHLNTSTPHHPSSAHQPVAPAVPLFCPWIAFLPSAAPPGWGGLWWAGRSWRHPAPWPAASRRPSTCSCRSPDTLHFVAGTGRARDLTDRSPLFAIKARSRRNPCKKTQGQESSRYPTGTMWRVVLRRAGPCVQPLISAPYIMRREQVLLALLPVSWPPPYELRKTPGSAFEPGLRKDYNKDPLQSPVRYATGASFPLGKSRDFATPFSSPLPFRCAYPPFHCAHRSRICDQGKPKDFY